MIDTLFLDDWYNQCMFQRNTTLLSIIELNHNTVVFEIMYLEYLRLIRDDEQFFLEDIRIRFSFKEADPSLI